MIKQQLQLQFLGESPSLRFEEVHKDQLLGEMLMGQVYKLRAEVYEKLGWSISDNPSMIQDKYDTIPSTTHFILVEDGKVIGANRMTRYSQESGLPCMDGKGHFFGELSESSENTRLLLKQDKKYPGAAKQILIKSSTYQLVTNSRKIVAIGFSDHAPFFQHIGYKKMSEPISCTLDEHQGEKVVRSGTPVMATSETLNTSIDLSEYTTKRHLIIVHNE